jgi:hypothetical protein
MASFKSLPHVGDPELHALGHDLLMMFVGQPQHRPTSYLTVHEQPERHYEVCPVCGYHKVPGGTFLLEHDYKSVRLDRLPYLCAHTLAAHGVAGPRESVELEGLRELLNKPERRLAERLVGLAAGADPKHHVEFTHRFTETSHTCKHCGDRLDQGALTLRRGSDQIALEYIALHSLLVHGDLRWVDTEGNTGSVRLEPLQALLDSGNELVEVGERLASLLPSLGGAKQAPAALILDENPGRGSETCERCEEHPNLGTFTLIHAKLGKQMTLPYLAVHTLRIHGTAHYVGGRHQGTVDVRLLERMLEDPS